GLQLIGTCRPFGKRLRDKRNSLRDLLPVPKRPVLLGKWDQLALRPRSRKTAGIREQHERKQSGDLRLAWLQIVDHPHQAYRLMRQVIPAESESGAAGVAFIEDEVDDMEDCAKTLHFLLWSRLLEWNARALDGLLGPADPLGHGRFGHEKSVRDLRGSQSA